MLGNSELRIYLPIRTLSAGDALSKSLKSQYLYRMLGAVLLHRNVSQII